MTVNVLYFGSSKGIGLTEHLTQYAIGLKKQGANITVIYSGIEQRKGLVEKLSIHNIRVILIPDIENWKSIKNYKMLSNLIDSSNAEIIQCQGIYHLIFSYISRKFSTKNPMIVTYVHAYAHREWYYKLFLIFTNPILNMLSDLIFAVSLQTRNILVKYGINEKKIIIVYNELNIKELRDNLNREYKADYLNVLSKIQGNKAIIWSSATLSEQKGHVTLLFAAKRVIEKFPNVFFILTGVGELKKELLKIATQLNIENNILFVGRLEYPSLLQLMNYSYMTVVPSYAETFCHSLIEPMSFGTPAISTPVGIAEEIIVDGESGFLVPIGNSEKLAEKIIYLLQNESLATQIGYNGMKLVENKFDIDVVSKSIIKIYLDLLKK